MTKHHMPGAAWIAHRPVIAGAFFVAALCLAAGQTAAAEKINVPPHDLTTFPKNLARNHAGAEIEVFGNSSTSKNLLLSEGLKDKNESPLSQLADDPSVGYPIEKGATTAIISIARLQALRYISFLTAEGLAAEMSIYTSQEELQRDSEKWIPARAAQLTPAQFQYAIDMTGIEARYVKLVFNTKQPGRIAGFGIYGEETVRDFIERDAEMLRNASKNEKTPVDIDLGALYAGASIRYVSSARDVEHAPRMIDDDPLTGFAFSPDDERPLIILDLGSPRLVSRASFVTSSMAGTIELSLRASTALKESEQEPAKNSQNPPPVPAPDSGNIVKKPEIVVPPQLAARRSVFTQVANTGAPSPASSRGAAQPGDNQRFEEDNGYFTVAKIEDKDGSLRKSVDFEPQIARFVLFRFTPDKRVSLSGRNFFVGDLSVFGDLVAGTPEGDAMTIEPPEQQGIRGGPSGGALAVPSALFIPVSDPNVGSN